MRLKAVHRLEGKDVIAPGAEFNAGKEVAERLIFLGAAVEIAAETAADDEAAETESKPAADKKTVQAKPAKAKGK